MGSVGARPFSEKKNLFMAMLRKLYFHFLSHWMGYDRGGSFHFDFEPNGYPSIWFKIERKMSPRSYPIQCERKWKHSFLSVPWYVLNWRKNEMTNFVTVTLISQIGFIQTNVQLNICLHTHIYNIWWAI